MTLSIKTIVIVSLILASTAYAAGRWSAPERVQIVTKTVEVEKKVIDAKTDLEKDKHKETVVTETVNPDGTKSTVTKTVEDTKTGKKTETSTVDDTSKASDTVKETLYSSSKVTVSLLAGMSLSGPITPVYGLSLTRPVLGPITFGAWGLTSGVVGLSVGLTF